MAYKITDECNNCAACEPECPNEAIFEGDDIFEIKIDLCTECVGFHAVPQCEEVCPADCCIVDPDHEETEAQLIEKAKKIHPDKDFSGDVPSRF